MCVKIPTTNRAYHSSSFYRNRGGGDHVYAPVSPYSWLRWPRLPGGVLSTPGRVILFPIFHLPPSYFLPCREERDSGLFSLSLSLISHSTNRPPPPTDPLASILYVSMARPVSRPASDTPAAMLRSSPPHPPPPAAVSLSLSVGRSKRAPFILSFRFSSPSKILFALLSSQLFSSFPAVLLLLTPLSSSL